MLVQFISYLWGMKTVHFSPNRQIRHKFISYLWGMKTLYTIPGRLRQSNVYILPLRNENDFWVLMLLAYVHVYILPLRNENSLVIISIWPNILFISYLWGMKTAMLWCSPVPTHSKVESFVKYSWEVHHESFKVLSRKDHPDSYRG